jgi:hypothetical protein
MGSATSAWADSEAEKALAEVNKIPPMEFVIAKGAADACGTGCDSWIAAEGRIVPGTPARLRAVLDKLGKRNLPIFFASPGGKVNEGLEIGRMLRQRKMTAGIGRTVPANCMPAKSLSDCGKLLREKPDSEATLWTKDVGCNSSCAYAILGAVKRDIAPTAHIGVHTVHFDHSALGQSTSQRQRDQIAKASEIRFRRQILAYLAEMKIDRALLELALQTKFEHAYFLTRAEIFDLGIDRREPIGAGWHFGYQPIPAVGNAASADLRIKADSEAAAKRIVLILSCGSRQRGNFTLTALQQVANSSSRPANELRVSVGKVGVTLTPANSFLTSHKNDLFEVRQESATLGMVGTLLGAPVLTVAEWPIADPGTRRSEGDAPKAQYSIPGARAPEVLKTLVAYCAP